MAISPKTRRHLWAKSGNRCAICKIELISKKEKASSDINIGEECHIISSKPTGPRHKTGLKNYDAFENLILLCRNHHKEVDELTGIYTEEVLRQTKNSHETWVKTTINNAINSKSKTKQQLLARITSGKILVDIISGAYGYRSDYDEAGNREDAEYLGGVIQDLVDYGDVSGMVDSSNHVTMAYDLGEILKNLEDKGYYLFAERNTEIVKFANGETDKWPIATIVIKRKDNPEIISLGLKTDQPRPQ